MFLPLGASWSLDARRRGGPSPPRLVTGGAPAALLLQVAFIYVFNALYKDGAAWTTDFTAVERFLANSVWGAPAGRHLLEYPGLLQALTAAPPRARAVLALGVGIAAAMAGARRPGNPPSDCT